jgi:hypothetical protein
MIVKRTKGGMDLVLIRRSRLELGLGLGLGLIIVRVRVTNRRCNRRGQGGRWILFW